MILVLNGGSSSWKSAAFDRVDPDASAASAALSEPLAQIDMTWAHDHHDATLELRARGRPVASRQVRVARDAAVPAILDALPELGIERSAIRTVGHRIVHGGARFAASVRIDEDVIAALRALAPFAPSHNPIELGGIAAAREALPDAVQVAVFDTTFHRTLPPHAYAYAGPYEWLAQEIRRYGFHGINVGYCVERAARLLDSEPTRLRLVVAHLGGGCSVTAVRDGKSADTTMGFTPLDGIAMATRSGNVDPGILVYLLRRAGERGTSLREATNALDATLNGASGMQGLSGISGDVRPLLAAEAQGNARARLALDVFVHRLAAGIASMLPSLERIDALIFTAGIGEHAAALRERTCAKLATLGIALDRGRNDAAVPDVDIAAADASARVLVIAAREEWTIARECTRATA